MDDLDSVYPEAPSANPTECSSPGRSRPYRQGRTLFHFSIKGTLFPVFIMDYRARHQYSELK